MYGKVWNVGKCRERQGKAGKGKEKWRMVKKGEQS